MELRQLRYFVAVAEELHFGRAAKRLHMAQSPLSRQIQGLERELRTRLLHRTTRSVSLTPAGAELLERGRSLLARADETVQVVRGLDGAARPLLRLGFTACAANAALGPVLRIVRSVTGELAADLRTDMLTPRQVEAVVRGDIDLGFVVRPLTPLPADLHAYTLLAEPLALVAPDGHRLTDVPEVPLTDLADIGLVGFPTSSGSATRGLLNLMCAEQGFEPRIVHAARDTSSVLGLVAAGVGCAVLPLSVRDGAAAGVSVRPLANAVTAEIAMIWRRSETRRPVLAVVDAVSRDFEPQRAGGPPVSPVAEPVARRAPVAPVAEPVWGHRAQLIPPAVSMRRTRGDLAPANAAPTTRR
ncbi:LysR family transcriptional regulator [Pseudonocardia sulfidoxydans NBRC 16205]|uniref:LysR family transcriptional regulator n=1 Tax=Pseudonocardia sulfidoxydans NBRC 16205 TaxID=1223511 RepID=A0A511DJ14_9PSEU|nr:LysR substrate-binding domain-containing protein [Pseudonocardia sulfidoxydans]GEL24805.1 LysR family transcriptional regulator [Pseudonocardia sulfidoxydans NBRC 16205]